MIGNQYDFFAKEYEKYKQILEEYKNDKSKVFDDENFHPNATINEDELDKDLYDDRDKISSFRDSRIIWRRIDEVYKAPLFEENKIHPLYISQGNLGDCYFITALTRVAKQSSLVQTLFEKQLPDQILGEVPNSINIKCGAVVIYFQAFGRRTPVLIDTKIPFFNGYPLFSIPINTSKSAWFCLVEKAFAKLNGCYSNIIGGKFCRSFYSLYGYYNTYYQMAKDAHKNMIKILKYQQKGYLMDTSIAKDNDDHVKKIQNLNLLETHSYLVLKVRIYNGSLFIQLRNPWGRKEYDGDLTVDTEKLSPQLRQRLKADKTNGMFWMAGNVFFDSFTRMSIAKPINPLWKTRTFTFKPIPTLYDARFDFDKQRSFCFKLNEFKNKKAKLRIIIEKRKTDFYNTVDQGYIITHICRNGGTKMISNDYSKDGFDILSFSLFLQDKDDVVTFSFLHITSGNNEADFYINTYCENDFEIYDVENPKIMFSRGEVIGAAFDNFSESAPNAALPLKEKYVNGKRYFYPDNPTISDFKNDAKESKDELIVNNLISQARTSLYNSLGNQIDLSDFIFNKEFIKEEITSSIYSITDKQTSEEMAAIISNQSIENFSKSFSEKVAIMRQLKYPSIINFIGFNEFNFSHKPNPVIITELFHRGTIFDALQPENKVLYKDWTATKKMINLIGIAFGMNYMHKHNIILRDLKCSNVMLDDKLYPKISNFESACFVKPEMEPFESNGICYFAAPEYIEGSTTYSFPIDVFSYGMLFYHIITDTEPTIKYKNEMNFYLQILKGKLPSLDIVPPKFHSFINEMWNIDAESRPTFDQIIDKLLNNRKECWLDNVDIDEVESYIHQFGASLIKKNQSRYINIINKINEEKYPNMTDQQIQLDSSISDSMKTDIRRADQLIENDQINTNDQDFLYQIAKELLTKLPQNFFNSIKYLKATTLNGHKESIVDLAKILCTKTKDQDSFKIGFDLANIASDFNSIESFILIGDLYNSGIGVKKNIVMAAINYKIAADFGNVDKMLTYARILMNFFNETISIQNKKLLLKEAKDIIASLNGKNFYFYEEARLTFNTIENNEALLYAAKKYFEMASKEGNGEAKTELESFNHEDQIYPPPYFAELCKKITADFI